jgi:hypothetical protein
MVSDSYDVSSSNRRVSPIMSTVYQGSHDSLYCDTHGKAGETLYLPAAGILAGGYTPPENYADIRKQHINPGRLQKEKAKLRANIKKPRLGWTKLIPGVTLVSLEPA